MLRPDATVLLTDALRPPAGYDVDVAVTTTYSLNLTAMLLAPMTFALAAPADSTGIDDRDPAQLLDAVQRFMQRTTVFCQAAGIHVPHTHSRIHTFLEDSLLQVEPPRDGALFHPKLWALRYRRAEDNAQFHRVVVSSRNLTLDNSWDTLLVLDEGVAGTIEAAPAADTVAAVTDMVLDPITDERKAAILDLATTLRYVRLDAPEPFTGGELLPLGLDDGPAPWPFPDRAKKTFAISPFLSSGTLSTLSDSTEDATLLTRADSADLLGAAATSRWDVNVLSAAVDRSDDPDDDADDSGPGSADEPAPATWVEFTGLHAKTVIVDHHDGRSDVITGSANLTTQAWRSNVEFDAVLTGPTRTCGVDAVLEQEGQGVGLRALMEPYTPAEDAVDDPSLKTGYLLEELHRSLARSTPRPQLHITRTGDDEVTARLTLTLPEDTVGETTIWPLTAPALQRPMAGNTSWTLSLDEITPFLAVETTAGHGAARATRRCLLKVLLVGDAIDRKQHALAAMLTSRDRVLRYLALLLGLDDPQSVHALEVDADTITSSIDSAVKDDRPQQTPPIVLFEPLVRAAGHDIDRILSVREQVRAVLDLPHADELIPPDFLHLWDVVLTFSLGRRSA